MAQKKDLPAAKIKLQAILLNHVGPENKIGMGALYRQVFETDFNHRINDTKALRNLITELRAEGLAVMSDCSSTGAGYWVAASQSEITDYCNRMQSRALGILRRAAAIKKISLPEYLGQVQMDLEVNRDADA